MVGAGLFHFWAIDSRRLQPMRPPVGEPRFVGVRERIVTVVLDATFPQLWFGGRRTLRLATGSGARQAGVRVSGRRDSPMRNRSTPRAASRPSAMAQTIRLWPRRESPAAKIPAAFVA